MRPARTKRVGKLHVASHGWFAFTFQKAECWVNAGRVARVQFLEAIAELTKGHYQNSFLLLISLDELTCAIDTRYYCFHKRLLTFFWLTVLLNKSKNKQVATHSNF